MRILDADGDDAEMDCDVWPLNLEEERARQLQHIHEGHSLTDCVVSVACLASILELGWEPVAALTLSALGRAGKDL